MRKKIFALADCNSFFASCERVFNPKLWNKPIIVLSNNDGCVVARTEEAKALKIPMGVPLFKVKDVIKRYNVQVFSSNFALYGDLSSRVMQTLSEFSPEIEIYSIDEAFLDLSGFESFGLKEYGKSIRERVGRYTGIPMSVGIAPTKVLSKVANHIAKKNKELNGVFELMSATEQNTVLEKFAIEDIWGVGRRSSDKLRALGIMTARQLRDAEEHKIQKILTITGRRIQSELRGISCHKLEVESDSKKQIICSRSFGRSIFELDELKESVALYVTRAAERLREQSSVCSQVQVFIHTNYFKNTKQYFNHVSLNLLAPTAATQRLIEIAFRGLKSIYRFGYEYKKSGVILTDIQPSHEGQMSFFEGGNPLQYEKDSALMKAIDKINSRSGQDTVKFGALGLSREWKMLSEHRSRCFTTRWADLLTVSS